MYVSRICPSLKEPFKGATILKKEIKAGLVGSSLLVCLRMLQYPVKTGAE